MLWRRQGGVTSDPRRRGRAELLDEQDGAWDEPWAW